MVNHNAYTYRSSTDLKKNYPGKAPKSIFTYSSSSSVKLRDSSSGEKEQVRLHLTITYYLLTGLAFFAMLITIPVSFWFSYKKCEKNSFVLRYRLGKLNSVVSSETHYLKLPLTDKIVVLDSGPQKFRLPPLMVSTSDFAVVQAETSVHYCVIDALKLHSSAKDALSLTKRVCCGSVSTIICRHSLSRVSHHRHVIEEEIRQNVIEMVGDWGIQIKGVDLSLTVLQQPAKNNNNLNKVMDAASKWLSSQNVKSESPLGAFLQNMAQSFQNSVAPNTALSTSENSQRNAVLSGTFSIGEPDCASVCYLQLVDITRQVSSQLQHRSPEATSGVVQLLVNCPENELIAVTLDLSRPLDPAYVGMSSTPTEVTVKLSMKTCIEIISGRMTPLCAFLSSLIEVSGDYSQLRRLDFLSSLCLNIDLEETTSEHCSVHNV